MAFWKPGTVAPGSNELRKSTKESDSLLVDRETEKETDVPVYNPLAAYSIQQQRVKLPIFKYKNEILYLIEKYPVVIIVGETGCGKTTQIPQYLHEAGWAKAGTKTIACTQPRRVAATSVAIRVAQEMGVPLGAEVGYSIRFDDRSDPNRTVIKYMTDGMLIREMMLDPLLSNYSVIMLDEAHERSLYTDILLGLLKKIQRKRKDLRLVVSSATIDAEDVKNFFSGGDNEHCYIMSIEGRTFPVDIHYLIKATNDYIQCALRTVLDIHKFQPEGDILVFLTGQEEIDNLVQLIKDRATDPSLKGTDRLRVLPMYSGLPHDQVMMVFESAPPNTRKVIVATNIAETSVTIDGIVYVVDSGFVKIRAYNPRLGIETLMVTPISQATAKQRAGRAGRNRPGKSYRLYSEDDYNKLVALPVPEMQRTNLATVVLQLKSLGIDNVLYFDFMSPPPVDNMIRALEILFSLGALDNDCKLTDPIGNTIAEFPLEPFMARMLISAGHEYKCSEEILTIASVLSVQSIFKYSPDQKHAVDQAKRKFAVYEGDHLTLLNVYNAFIRAKKSPDWCRHFHLNYKALMKAGEIRNQLKKYMKRWRIPLISAEKDFERILKSIVSGFFAQAAHLQPDGTYKPVRGGPSMVIHPVSVLTNRNPEWVIYHEVVQTTEDRIHMREVSAVEPNWLAEIAPHFYEFSIKALQHTERMQQEPEQANKYRSVF